MYHEIGCKGTTFFELCKNGSRKIMFFCVFGKNGSYSGDLCYSISAKSSNFALKM